MSHSYRDKALVVSSAIDELHSSLSKRADSENMSWWYRKKKLNVDSRLDFYKQRVD
jgi:hypothetical protein